jgi:hypothetical protein
MVGLGRFATERGLSPTRPGLPSFRSSRGFNGPALRAAAQKDLLTLGVHSHSTWRRPAAHWQMEASL